MIMSEINHKLIGDNQPNLNKDHIHFTNMNLDETRVIAQVTPIMDVICN